MNAYCSLCLDQMELFKRESKLRITRIGSSSNSSVWFLLFLQKLCIFSAPNSLSIMFHIVTLTTVELSSMILFIKQ